MYFATSRNVTTVRRTAFNRQLKIGIHASVVGHVQSLSECTWATARNVLLQTEIRFWQRSHRGRCLIGPLFLERYYAPRARSINQLVLLAGHVIRTASDLAKDWVDGLEIATCTPKGNPEFVQLKTLKVIGAKSDHLSGAIERSLRTPLSHIRRSQRRAML